jgi:hypothetical protein
MNNIKSFFNKLNVLVVLLMVMVTAAAFAADFRPVADEMMGAGGISWIPKVNYAQLVLTISRPNGTVFRRTFASGSSPYVDLSSIFGGSYLDGSYIYELRVIPDVQPRVRYEENDMLSSREAARQQVLSGPELTQTGAFLIQGGAIVSSDMTEPQVSPMISSGQEGLSGTMDFVIADDLIVQGSACIGFDCVNGESFSFDTIRLKENNTRIKFEDTSVGSFPSNDWQLTANDSASGGANKFSIDDVNNSRTPFTVLAGAPNNALFVSSTGRVGFGTSTPVLDLHKVSGNTPSLRLEQNGSSGFTPQTWDIAGNEANFFVRDVTSGSRLPFRIRPGAPTSSIDIAGNGNVGIGTASPGFPVHLLTNSSTNAAIVAERTGGATNFMSATATFGQFGTVSNHPVRILVNSASKMQLNADNSLSMTSGASCTAGGVWTNASSKELKENIQSLTTDEALNALNGINPVKYNYKVDKTDKHVGFIAEDAPELVATPDKKGMSPMDVVAVLTKVVQEQQKSILEQQNTIAELKNEIAEMKKK